MMHDSVTHENRTSIYVGVGDGGRTFGAQSSGSRYYFTFCLVFAVDTMMIRRIHYK